MGVFSVSKYLGEDSVKEVNKNTVKKAIDVAVIHPLRQPKCTSPTFPLSLLRIYFVISPYCRCCVKYKDDYFYC